MNAGVYRRLKMFLVDSGYAEAIIAGTQLRSHL
jgi:hypothetical protein